MRKLIYFFAIVLATSCSDNTAKNMIVIGDYSFEFPNGFKIIKEKGIDSDVGKIEGDNITLNFDYGYYSNPLVQSQEEFLKDGFWLLHANERFMKEGITYDKNNSPKVDFVSLRQPATKDTIRFKNADFIAICKYDSLIFEYPVTIPDDIKQHFVNVDTIQNHFKKIVTAKDPIKDVTGIYLKDLNSFNESMNSYLALSMTTSKLNKQQQDEVLKIFSTVQFVYKK